jgi:trans-aconitate methyltransferase
MDLSERRSENGVRHPWETARARALEQIVRDLAMAGPRVLDVGCGDGYVVRQLKRELGFAEVVAQDIHLGDELIQELAAPDMRFVRDLSTLEYRADLLLLLDVLEHVQNPDEFLLELKRRHLAPSGRVVITVPAFQWLFSDHDRALRHFRRYSRAEIMRTVRGAGLEVLDSGYLFASLLMPRLAAAVLGRARRAGACARAQGVGEWSASPRLTRLVHGVLTFDNIACLAAQRRGILLPGLSIWLTCKASP